MRTRHITITIDFQLDCEGSPVATAAAARSAAIGAIKQVAEAANEQARVAPERSENIHGFRLEPSFAPLRIRHTVDCVRCKRWFACIGPYDDEEPHNGTQGDGCACWVIFDAKSQRHGIEAFYGSSFDLDLFAFAEEPPLFPHDARLCDDCVQKLVDDQVLVPTGSRTLPQ